LTSFEPFASLNLKAPELQRLSVTVEVLRVGVMIVGVISVRVMNVGCLEKNQFTPFPKCYMSKKSKVESTNFIIETNCDCGETDGIQIWLDVNGQIISILVFDVKLFF
jgi:hypothetical protein